MHFACAPSPGNPVNSVLKTLNTKSTTRLLTQTWLLLSLVFTQSISLSNIFS